MEQESEDKAALRAAVIAAAACYFAARRAKVDWFVDRWFGFRGSLRLHRAAFGWDIARAPANIGLAPVHIGTRLAALAATAARRPRAAAWLGSRQVLLETDVMRRVRALVLEELLELPSGPGAGADALAAAIAADPEVHRLLSAGGAPPARLDDLLSAYAGTRAAVAEMTTALAVLGAGAAAFHQVTPGALTLGPALAAAMAQSAAISAFPLGPAAGSLWYAFTPAATSPALMIGTTAGLIGGAAVFAAFAGVIADPAQRALGLHRRRLLRLIDAMERDFTEGTGGGFAAREHYVARLFDLLDLGVGAMRL